MCEITEVFYSAVVIAGAIYGGLVWIGISIQRQRATIIYDQESRLQSETWVHHFNVVIFYVRKVDAERDTENGNGERVQKVRITPEEDSCK